MTRRNCCLSLKAKALAQSHWPAGAPSLLAVVLLAACAAPKQAARGVDLEGPKVAAPSAAVPGKAAQKPEVPQISSRAKLTFEDAVKAFEAQKKAKSFDYAGLERKFTAALEADPRLAEAEYNLGVLAERQGKKEQAALHYRRALDVKPTLKEAAENLAVIAQNDGDVQGAVKIYQKILSLYPDDASSRARLAEVYRQGGEHDRAMELARAALVREPKTLAAYKVMMLSYLDRKQLSMARLVALRALKLDDGDPELYHTIGLILVQENEPAKARLQFQKAIEVRPDYQPARIVLATLALKDEDYSGAEEHLRRVLMADGKSAEAHLNLGVAYKGMGQYDKALQEYDAAEKLNPELAATYLNRGIILARHKDAPERGIELYKKYLLLAGGEVALAPGAPVFGLLREAEQVIQAKLEEQRALEEAKRMEEEAKAAEARAKAEEEKQKQEEQRAKAVENAAQGADKTAPSDEQSRKPTGGPPPPAPPPVAPAAAPTETPKAKPKPASDEPSDEPQDAL